MDAKSQADPKPATESFCWIRTLRVTDDATVPAESVFVRPTSWSRHGGRPPAKIASTAEVDRSCTNQEFNSVAVWSGVADFSGKASADTVFDYGPVFVDHTSAIDWLRNTSDGQQWECEALNYMLMQVGWGRKVTLARDGCVQDQEVDTDCPPSPAFPATAWSDTAYNRHLSANPDDLLFNPDDIQCPDICGIKSEEDCAAVAAAVSTVSRGTPQDQQIRHQAHGMGQALLPVFEVIGVDPDRPECWAWKNLIAKVAEPAEVAIFLQKRKHGRRRPWQACEQPVPPMFSQQQPVLGGGTRPHLLYPGHPSYPSGHAVMAYVWAGLIATVTGDPGGKLTSAAKQVSDNRVAAGLHYPSDVEAAKVMAREIVDSICRGTEAKKVSFVHALKSLLVK